MVRVRKMCVFMLQRLVIVNVRMRLITLPVRAVRVPVVFVVHVAVFMPHGYVAMPVRMMLCQMQPHATAHEDCGGNERDRHGRAKNHGK